MILDKRKKYFLLIDVETANSIAFPLVYDIGLKVVTKKGEVLERTHFLIKEIFDNNNLMQGAYYKNKLPIYYDMLDNDEITKKSYEYVLDVIQHLLDKYNISTIAAYNVDFDTRALIATMKYLFNMDKGNLTNMEFLSNVFNRELEKLCIMRFACETIMTQKTFILQAIRYNWISDKGNIKTSAEYCYKYISNNPNFVESHTGLADCDIETEILALCFRQKKKFSKKTGTGWHIVNKRYKELSPI